MDATSLILLRHLTLSLKLGAYGLNSQLLNWLATFFSNRSQCVNIEDEISHSLPVFRGAPQGSVLGPLLFLLYINDLPNCLHPSISIKVYADDTKTLLCSQ